MNRYNVLISIGTHSNINVPNILAIDKKQAFEQALDTIKQDRLLRGRLPRLPENFCRITKIN